MTRRNKYGVSIRERRTVFGITFDSKLEMERYLILKKREQCGLITELEAQPHQPAFTIELKGKKICTYKADFRYRNAEGERVIEDVKGMPTPVYRLKKKLVEAQYGIEITEIRKKNLTQ